MENNNQDDINIEIQKALAHYTKHKANCRKYFNKRYHNDESFREKQKEISRNNYIKNKEKIAAKYQIQKPYKKALRKYNYYKNKDELDIYKQKYKEEYEMYFID